MYKRQVHTLDGLAHRVRKAMFLSLLEDEKGVEALREHVLLRWREAVGRWRGAPEKTVVLFDEAAGVLALAVCDWTGVPLPLAEADGGQLARDCLAMVRLRDGRAAPVARPPRPTAAGA